MTQSDIIRLMGINVIEKTQNQNLLAGPAPHDVLGREFLKSKSRKQLTAAQKQVAHAYAAQDYQHSALRAYDLIQRAAHLSPTSPDRADYLNRASRLLSRLDDDITIGRRTIPSYSISSLHNYDQLRTQVWELKQLWHYETEFPARGVQMAELTKEFETALSDHDWISAAVIESPMNELSVEDIF